MASFITNRGKAIILDAFFRNQNQPASFEVHLVTGASTPTVDTNDLSELTEVANGNGYTTSTGFQLSRNTTDWDTLNEDDGGNLANLLAKDVVWTASGGPIPASGDAARWAACTTPGATAADKKILLVWDLGADRPVSIGQNLTLENADVRLTE